MPDQKNRLTHTEFFKLTERLRNNEEAVRECRSYSKVAKVLLEKYQQTYSPATIAEAMQATGMEFARRAPAAKKYLRYGDLLDKIEKAATWMASTQGVVMQLQSQVQRLEAEVRMLLDDRTRPQGVPVKAVVDPKTLAVVNKLK